MIRDIERGIERMKDASRAADRIIAERDKLRARCERLAKVARAANVGLTAAFAAVPTADERVIPLDVYQALAELEEGDL